MDRRESTAAPTAVTRVPRRPGRPVGKPASREGIVAAAEDLFAASGFEGASVRQIAAAAGLSSAALLHHFPSKEALYGEILHRISESFEGGWLDAALAAPAGGEAEAVLEMVDWYVAWTAAHDRYSRIILRDVLENGARAEGARRWYLAPLVVGAAALVCRARDAGAIRAVDPELFVLQFVGTTAYFFVAIPTLQLTGNDAAARERAALVARFRAEIRRNTRALLAPASTARVPRARGRKGDAP